MKFALVAVIVLAFSRTFSQQLPPDELNRFNHSNYSSFREYLQRNVSIPPEALNRTGVLLSGFILSPKGEIVNVFNLNSLTPAFDNQILDLIESTSGFWKARAEQGQSNKNSMIIIPIVLCLKNSEYVIRSENAKIKLEDKIEFTVMIGQEQMSASGYVKTDKLVKSLNEFILKDKFDKAVETVTELLRRDPLNTEYFSKLIEIELKLDKNEDACSNLKFVKAYLVEQPKDIQVNCN